MKVLVIYGSRHGNTQRVAEAIGGGMGTLGSVQLVDVDAATPAEIGAADLIVVGGPTEAHGMTEPLKLLFTGVHAEAMKGKAAAAFDTRLDWPAWLSGSAAAGIEARLRHAGARLVASPASFIVKGKEPALEPGELARATQWGLAVAREAVALLQPARG